MFFVLRTSVWIKDERRLIHMKDFFENFGKRFGETAEMVTNKAGEMIEIQRVKSQIRDLARENAVDMMELGKAVYERYKSGEELDDSTAQICDSIKEREKEIEKYERKIAVLKGSAACVKCGRMVSEDMAYCPYCGEKMEARLVQAHFFQQAVNFLGALGLVLIQVVDIHALGDDIADGHAGVQGSVRVLEDHLSLPLIGEQLTAFQGVNVLAPVEHLSIGLVVHAQAGAAAGGLTAAGLAHQAQRLALTDAERNVVHRVQGAAMAEIEVFFQVADFQHNIILHSGPPV